MGCDLDFLGMYFGGVRLYIPRDIFEDIKERALFVVRPVSFYNFQAIETTDIMNRWTSTQ